MSGTLLIGLGMIVIDILLLLGILLSHRGALRESERTTLQREFAAWGIAPEDDTLLRAFTVTARQLYRSIGIGGASGGIIAGLIIGPVLGFSHASSLFLVNTGYPALITWMVCQLAGGVVGASIRLQRWRVRARNAPHSANLRPRRLSDYRPTWMMSILWMVVPIMASQGIIRLLFFRDYPIQLPLYNDAGYFILPVNLLTVMCIPCCLAALITACHLTQRGITDTPNLIRAADPALPTALDDVLRSRFITTLQVQVTLAAMFMTTLQTSIVFSREPGLAWPWAVTTYSTLTFFAQVALLVAAMASWIWLQNNPPLRRRLLREARP